MRDLSVLIPARNEEFLQNTIDDVIKNKRANTEVIAVLDGYWPDKPIPDHKDIQIIHHTESVGQRAATNEAARLSNAKYIMKCDAHIAFDVGFDAKLLNDMQYHFTMVPRMYNLHVFDWICESCGTRYYQDTDIRKGCPLCKGSTLKKEIVWRPRKSTRCDFTTFDNTLHYQYWREYEKRPEARGDICDVMGNLGACWLMNRERYWDLGGLDEAHGSWGQMGVEISCKTWLSGGRQVVNKKTWFSHLFRTKKHFGFPYKISDEQIDGARKLSRELYLEGKADLYRKISWIIKKFKPVPTWGDEWHI